MWPDVEIKSKTKFFQKVASPLQLKKLVFTTVQKVTIHLDSKNRPIWSAFLKGQFVLFQSRTLFLTKFFNIASWNLIRLTIDCRLSFIAFKIKLTTCCCWGSNLFLHRGHTFHKRSYLSRRRIRRAENKDVRHYKLKLNILHLKRLKLVVQGSCYHRFESHFFWKRSYWSKPGLVLGQWPDY